MFEDKLKKSFFRVKRDINNLNARISTIEAKLDQILNKLDIIGKTKNVNSNEFEGINPPIPQIQGKIPKNSTGNKGVYSFIHSPFIHSFTDHSLNIQELKKDLENKFNQLTSQEFLVFLTIYQLEEELGRAVVYADLSTRLRLSTGCIRSYISSIIRKGLPIIKQKVNNKIITLRIHQDFKELNLKERLTNLYYNKDLDQTKLFY